MPKSAVYALGAVAVSMVLWLLVGPEQSGSVVATPLGSTSPAAAPQAMPAPRPTPTPAAAPSAPSPTLDPAPTAAAPAPVEAPTADPKPRAAPRAARRAPSAAETTTTQAPPAGTVQELSRAATAAVVQGQTDRAHSIYRTLVRMDPGNAEAWRGLAVTASRLGQRAEAKRALDRYLALRPGARDADAIRRQVEQVR